VKQFKSEKRLNKFYSVAGKRQFSFNVVLENIHDPHNVSAIFRTCDAAGIPAVSLLYTQEKFPRIGKKSSASAFKWVEKEKYQSVDECYASLRKKGFKIYASSICEGSVDFYQLDLTTKCAVVLGNEHRGVSEEAAALADERFVIPMHGMVQSLNVSVAAAVIIYEALRQRTCKGMYDKSELTKETIEEIIDNWCRK
jgi:tRNA (guanosine-2'-O-)-methyltransferase